MSETFGYYRNKFVDTYYELCFLFYFLLSFFRIFIYIGYYELYLIYIVFSLVFFQILFIYAFYLSEFGDIVLFSSFYNPSLFRYSDTDSIKGCYQKGSRFSSKILSKNNSNNLYSRRNYRGCRNYFHSFVNPNCSPKYHINEFKPFKRDDRLYLGGQILKRVEYPRRYCHMSANIIPFSLPEGLGESFLHFLLPGKLCHSRKRIYAFKGIKNDIFIFH